MAAAAPRPNDREARKNEYMGTSSRMKTALEDVRGFMHAGRQSTSLIPTIPTGKCVKLRKRLLAEERKELNRAIADGDLADIAKEIVDEIYVLIGLALECGIPLDRVWEEVQRSNMAKVDRKTGMVAKRPDGKILKPAGWTPPDIRKVLGL